MAGRLPIFTLTAALILGLSSTGAAQIDEPETTCFEPVKPSCAEVTVGGEEEGWAKRCREELATFLQELEGYRQCVNHRLDRIQERAEEEVRQMECLAEGEEC